jgi:hypothetical protein
MSFYTQHRVAPRHPVPVPWFNSAPLPSDFSFLTSALSFTYFQPLTDCPRLATLSAPLSFQQVTTIKFCNSFLLITIQIAPGWVYPPAAIGLKFHLKSLATDSLPRSPHRAQPNFEFRISSFHSLWFAPSAVERWTASSTNFAFRISSFDSFVWVFLPFESAMRFEYKVSAETKEYARAAPIVPPTSGPLQDGDAANPRRHSSSRQTAQTNRANHQTRDWNSRGAGRRLSRSALGAPPRPGRAEVRRAAAANRSSSAPPGSEHVDSARHGGLARRRHRRGNGQALVLQTVFHPQRYQRSGRSRNPHSPARRLPLARQRLLGFCRKRALRKLPARIHHGAGAAAHRIRLRRRKTPDGRQSMHPNGFRSRQNHDASGDRRHRRRRSRARIGPATAARHRDSRARQRHRGHPHGVAKFGRGILIAVFRLLVLSCWFFVLVFRSLLKNKIKPVIPSEARNLSSICSWQVAVPSFDFLVLSEFRFSHFDFRFYGH